MNCPNCGQPLPNVPVTNCPVCGYALVAPAGMPAPIPSSDTPQPPPTPSMPGTNAVPTGYPYPSVPYPPYPYAPYPAGAFMAPSATPSTQRWVPWVVSGSIAVVVLLVVCIGTAIAVGHGRTVTSFITVYPSTGTATSSISYSTLFKDPLTSPQYRWSNDTHCFFSADGYHDKGYFCFAPIGELANGIISEDLKQIAGPIDIDHGIVFRRTGVSNEYIFEIGSDGDWVFGKYINGVFTEIIPYAPTSVIHSGLGASNSLKVIMNGSHFTFFINGVQVGQASDTTYTTGKCGVADDSGTEAVFTNFEVDLPNS